MHSCDFSFGPLIVHPFFIVGNNLMQNDFSPTLSSRILKVIHIFSFVSQSVHEAAVIPPLKAFHGFETSCTGWLVQMRLSYKLFQRLTLIFIEHCLQFVILTQSRRSSTFFVPHIIITTVKLSNLSLPSMKPRACLLQASRSIRRKSNAGFCR